MSPPVELQDYIGGLSDQRHLKETELRLGLPGSDSPERKKANSVGLTLGLQTNTNVPGGPTNKRGFSDSADQDKKEAHASAAGGGGKAHDSSAAGKSQNSSAAAPPAAKTQAVGWPPIRNYRKNTMATNPSKNKEDGEVKQGHGFLYIKVSMDGAPYLRKVDLRTYSNYKDLSSALEKMFSCFTIGQCGSSENPSRDGLSESRLMDLLNGSEYVLTYEDKDGDWMLVGDVPWQMFTDSCRRMRIMKSSDAIGLAPRAMEKSKNRH